MNYVYGVLLLHSAGKELSEASVSKVVEATGEKADPAQVKALVASLQGVNIEEAIKQAVVSAAPAVSTGSAPAAEKKEEKKEDEGKKAEEAAAGLSGLFG
ncbi:MAG: 50S ribosomal protein P1 [Candidatus Aenigmarchaeota archaeon]|nr:50S ribosomal protein P1 [Candidatus Aenigmarchaeota archaeon]